MEVLRQTGRFLSRKSEYVDFSGEYKVDDDGNNDTRSSSQVCDNVIPESNDDSENALHSSVIIASQDLKPFLKSEQFKAFSAFVLLIFAFFSSLISLALTHDKLPDRRFYKPLPDIVLDNVKSIDFLLNVTEVQILIIVNGCIVMVFFHKHRLVIAKRCFFLLSILYLYRGVTMFVTVLPISSRTYYCSPKSNATSSVDVVRRALKLFSGMGLSINNKQTYCGDSIFSGHATILVFGYLVINKYTPNKLKFLRWLVAINAISGITCLLLSHSHYTIDVIIAYYITTRLFWTYHSLCHLNENSSSLKDIRREWWIFIFDYLESNSISITNEFHWPFKSLS